MEVDEKKDEEKKDEKEKPDEPEPNFEMLSNPARVMKTQLKVISLEDGKYRPMKDLSIGGVIMLDRSTEIGVDEKEEIVEPILVNRGGASSDPQRLELTRKKRSWSQSWSTEEGPAQTTARRSPHLQSRSNTRRIESFSFYGICYERQQ